MSGSPIPMQDANALMGCAALNIMLGAKAGGLEAMALNTHRALRSQGARVISVAAPGGWFAGAFADEPGEVIALPTWTPLDPTAAVRLRRAARRFAPNLVIAHGSRAVKLAVDAFRGRAPVVAVVHNFRAKAELAGVDLAVCVSAAVARDVGIRFPGVRTAVVENFAPLAAGSPRPDHAGPPHIGAVGRLHRNKGFDVLLAAAALLRDRGVDFRLTIAGDGPERQALQRQAEALNLKGRVAFPGWLAAPAELLGAIDLFVLSSIVEPFGLVVIEAMAQGAPVIATDIDGPRDILDGGRLGRLVPPGRPEALADAIGAVLADLPSARILAREAQAAALARYSMEAGGRRLAQAIAPLIQSVAHPA